MTPIDYLALFTPYAVGGFLWLSTLVTFEKALAAWATVRIAQTTGKDPLDPDGLLGGV